MPIVIENGGWAAGAGVMAAAGGVLWVLQRKRSRRWRWACAGLPGIAAVCMALAMAGLAIVSDPLARRVVVLVDLSGSARTSAWRDPAWVRGLVDKRLAAGTGVTVVAFGGRKGPRVLVEHAVAGREQKGDDGVWPAAWPSVDGGEGSDIDEALAWRSAAELKGEPAAPRWVLTDGLVEGGKGSIAPRDFRVGWTGMEAREADVGVAEVAARSLPTEEGAEISARIAATGKLEANVEISRDGAVLFRHGMSFDGPGTRWVSVSDVPAKGDGGGRHRYKVSVVEAGGGDPWPEDDRGSVTWAAAKGAMRVLVVGGMEGLEGLKGVHVGAVKAGEFPGQSGELVRAGWQVIVLNDVPLGVPLGEGEGALPARAGGVLDRFVRETGGGLVIVGRKHAFGAGHYAEAGLGQGTVEGLSPVSSEDNHRPAARVVFLLDASGSMNDVAGGSSGAAAEQKFRLAARGAEEAMGLLGDDDVVTVVTFNDAGRVLAQGTKAELSRGGQLRGLLDDVRQTGNTAPDSALAEVARGLGEKGAATGVRLVVLLTDGEIPAMDGARWKAALAGARLAIVAPAPESASPLLKLSKEVGGLWLGTEDAGQWGALLKRAVGTAMSGKASAEAVAWRGEGAIGAGLSGVAQETVKVWKKPEAVEVAETAQGGGILAAVAQRGLGKAAAVAMGDSGGDYGELLQRLVEVVAPAAGDRRFELAARREGDHWRVTAEGAENRQFLDHEILRVRTLSGESGEQVMQQTGPGRYEARVRDGAGLTAVVVREAAGKEALVGRIQAGSAGASEWPACFESGALLAPAGAEVIAADGAGLWRPRRVGVRWELARWLWMGAVLGALGAMGLRRGPLGRGAR